MDKNYKLITSMKEVPEQLRKLRRQYLRYQQAEIIYSISHKKLFELASDAGAIYRIDGTVLINRDIFDAYLERFHEPATGKDKVVYRGYARKDVENKRKWQRNLTIRKGQSFTALD